MVAPLLTLGVFALVLGGFVWLGTRMRERGIPGSVMAPFEEQWDPTAFNTGQETVIQHERKAETPSPGDPLLEQGGDRGPS